MKKFLAGFIVMSIIVLWSCSTVRYNKVYNYDDEFRGSSREYVRLVLKPEERRTEIGHARLIFERVEGTDGAYHEAYIVIMRAASSFGADRKAFLKAGEDKYELELKDPVSEYRTRTDETVSTYISKDTSGVSVSTTTDIDTRTWIEEKFIIKIPGESINAIMGSEELLFRFYFGPVPATYSIKGKKLGLIKVVIV